ncbi:uncharacterized protein LOC100906261 [Galendromus occidentalis]|uniref:Uncharacterized protein LOC100906261 n=1 Tax=Galendromus occidentalis TaxID=34638 RepID=A0AAJ6QS53_9ACAR|nr:uncharacterized protein LOC100906261 [Galendromus occidentalis]
MVCSVLKCKNRTCANRKQGVSFHKFPLKNTRLLKVWLRNISRPGNHWQPSPRSRICSDHFDQESLVKKDGRVELKDNAVPTLQISFRAKDAPDIVESLDQVPDAADHERPASPIADHSYSSADQEPVASRSVEVAMKEHSYFTGVALQCASPAAAADQPMLPEALEAPDDHTYHTNIPIRLSLDDHTYNRGEAALVNPLSKTSQSDDLKESLATAANANIEEEQREESCIRNFDHTYNNKKNAESPAGTTTPQDSEPPVASQTAPLPAVGNNGNQSTLRKGQKRQSETPGWKELFEENQSLKNKLNASTHKSSELSSKLTEATDRIRTLQDHVRRLKKTLAEVVLESVEAIETKSAKNLKPEKRNLFGESDFVPDLRRYRAHLDLSSS